MKSNYNSVDNKWKRMYSGEKNPIEPRTYFTDKIKRFKKEEPFVRPKAVYDNPNWEERINTLLAEGTGHD